MLREALLIDDVQRRQISESEADLALGAAVKALRAADVLDCAAQPGDPLRDAGLVVVLEVVDQLVEYAENVRAARAANVVRPGQPGDESGPAVKVDRIERKVHVAVDLNLPVDSGELDIHGGQLRVARDSGVQQRSNLPS